MTNEMAKTRAGRFLMMADAYEKQAQADPANAQGLLDQASEMRRLAQIADAMARMRARL